MKKKPFKSEFNELILDDMSRNNIKCWIAGGVLRDYFAKDPMVTDCDMFFPNEEEFIKARKFLKDNGGLTTWESENGMKVNYKDSTFDLVKFYANSPEETIDKFDFTVSQIAIDGDHIYYGDTTFDDLKEKKLELRYITNPLSTLKRVLSHYAKGYKMLEDEILKLYTDVFVMSDYKLDAVSPYQEGEIIRLMKKERYNNYVSVSGVPDVEVGKIMSRGAYLGVIAGLIGSYSYLGLLKDGTKKKDLFIAGAITLLGLGIGSYWSARVVDKKSKIKK